MIITKNCEALYDAFIAAGLNSKQVLQDLAAIVQNDGVELSEKDIQDWTVNATQKLCEIRNQHLMLVDSTLEALTGMDTRPALGYRKNGQPIYQIKPGIITTACVISCSECQTIIRGMGGPIRDAYCIPCFEKEQTNASSNSSSPECP